MEQPESASIKPTANARDVFRLPPRALCLISSEPWSEDQMHLVWRVEPQLKVFIAGAAAGTPSSPLPAVGYQVRELSLRNLFGDEQGAPARCLLPRGVIARTQEDDFNKGLLTRGKVEVRRSIFKAEAVVMS